MNESLKLLDNGWNILLFREGHECYTALVCKKDQPLDQSYYEMLKACDDDELSGANRYVASGSTIDEALRNVTEKVIFNRVPERIK